MKNFRRLAGIVVWCCIPLLAGAAGMNEKVLVSQTGYGPGFSKIAVVRTTADSFLIRNDRGDVVFKAALSTRKYWPFSGEWVQWADFTALKEPGGYVLELTNKPVSQPFSIVADPYGTLADAAVKALYYNRCSSAILPEYGGTWSRKAGHPDTKVLVHPSAATAQRPAGTVISSPGGWYDAGDYNKYIVNSGISTFTLLLAYECHPAYWSSRKLNIPESGNHLPDVLDEALNNLRWMLTMQDTDGGPYHKLTTLAFEPFVMPSETHETRYVVQKTTAAALDFAATMAHASRLFASFGDVLPGLSDTCRLAAERAWQWANSHPAILYKQPADISTGAYGDGDLKDDWFWAGIEMSLLGSAAFPDSLMDRVEIRTPAWNHQATLGLISALLGDKVPAESKDACRKRYLAYVDHLTRLSMQSGYPVSLNYFDWGSNSDVANQGMLKMIAYQLTGETRYLDAAVTDMNYLTGTNPTGYCYITGFGWKSPMHIHHRPSESDGNVQPVPGFLAGGPNTVVMTDCPDAVRSTMPALSYVDELCSYSTNEIAINWNTPLAFLASALGNNCKVLPGSK